MTSNNNDNDNDDQFDELVGDVEIDDRGVVEDYDRGRMWINATEHFFERGESESYHKLVSALGSLVGYRRFPSGAVNPDDVGSFPPWRGEDGTVVIFVGSQLVATCDVRDLFRES
ncbi:MAG TPA: hypothetical protein VFZ70_01055 [Euzebyales bacterium]